MGDFRKTWANVCVAAGVGAFHCPNCDKTVTVTANATTVHCGKEWRRCDLRYRGLIFHDLRRCAVRGLMKAGVAQKTAMMITGHRTVAVFHRYHIIAPSDLQSATRKLEVSQKQDRDLLQKSDVSDFGQRTGSLAPQSVRTDEIGVPAVSPTALAN